MRAANIKSTLKLNFEPDLMQLLERKIKVNQHIIYIIIVLKAKSFNDHHEYKLLGKFLAAFEPMVSYGFRWNINEDNSFDLLHFVMILEKEENVSLEGESPNI